MWGQGLSCFQLLVLQSAQHMTMYNSSDQQLFWYQGLCLPLILQENTF